VGKEDENSKGADLPLHERKQAACRLISFFTQYISIFLFLMSSFLIPAAGGA
jgi:hypothetical protein